MEILFQNKLLYKFQSGFIPGHSTSHQLIELYHRIVLALEAKQVTSVTFADISKAFDTVWVKALLYILGKYKDLSPFLNRRITWAIFQSDGNTFSHKDLLNKLHNGFDISSFTDANILLLIISGPTAENNSHVTKK
jgi:hypothetical protein